MQTYPASYMDIQKLPKVDLHRHLELSLRPSTIKELAPQFGIHLTDEKSFAEHFLITEPMNDLGSVLNKFLDTQKLLASEEILERITYEICEDAVNENIKILELRYAPTFVQQNHKNLDFEKIHRAIVKGKERAEKDFPICVGLICIIQRILPVKEAEKVAHFAIAHKDSFVGLDLADNEVGFDSKPFAPFFLKAKKEGLGITVHSGEANVPNAPRYVKEAIECLEADRIGHGVMIYKDPEMINYVAQKGIPLELCPTSNWLTQAVETLEDHPFRMLYENGIKTTINTDDPGIFNTSLTQEYRILHNLHDLTEHEFERCAQFAAESSFIPLKTKQKYWPHHLES